MTTLACLPILAAALNSSLATGDAIPSDVLRIVLVGLFLGLIAVIGSLISHYHRDKMRHETIRLALEKGQPVPATILEPDPRPTIHRPRNDRRNGIILLAVAVGLFIYLIVQEERRAAFAACIPAAIGVALLLNATLDDKERRVKESVTPKV